MAIKFADIIHAGARRLGYFVLFSSTVKRAVKWLNGKLLVVLGQQPLRMKNLPVRKHYKYQTSTLIV